MVEACGRRGGGVGGYRPKIRDKCTYKKRVLCSMRPAFSFFLLHFFLWRGGEVTVDPTQSRPACPLDGASIDLYGKHCTHERRTHRQMYTSKTFAAA